MTGKKALEMLAHRYPQLYLDPDAEGAEDACRHRRSLPEWMCWRAKYLRCFVIWRL